MQEQQFQYGLSGEKLTEAFEGLRLQSYQDVAGVWTVGYGHTGPDVYPGQMITEAQAIAFLEHDVASAVRCVNEAVSVSITQNEFDALVDFAFNEGNGAFRNSTLLRDLNAGNFASAADQFSLWVNAGGHRVPGLVKRRQQERLLFLTQ